MTIRLRTTIAVVFGQPNGLPNEIECGPLAMNVAPPGLHLTFVATTTAPVECRSPFELDVSSTGTGPLTRVDDVTYAGSCATLKPVATVGGATVTSASKAVAVR